MTQYGRDEVETFLVGHFYPIKLLASGACGEVWYAVPTIVLWHYYKNNPGNDHPVRGPDPPERMLSSDYARGLKDISSVKTASDLAKHICVVKIWFQTLGYGPVGPPAVQRQKAYKMSQRLDEIGAQERFIYPQVLDSGYLHRDDVHWQASTLIAGFELWCLKAASEEKPIPQALIAHIAIQLHDIFSWLHKPANKVYHNDAHPGNIMLDPTTLDASGFPKLAIIDWDMDHCKDNDPTLRDREKLCRNILWLMTLHRDCHDFHNGGSKGTKEDCKHDEFWVKFATALAGVNQNRTMLHVEFQSSFYKGLVECRDNASEQEKTEIRELLNKGKTYVKRISEDEILKGLNR